MYDFFRRLCEKWLRIPPEPEPPPGDEASSRVFRASPQYLKYLRVLWGIRTVFAFGFTLVPLFVIGAVIAASGIREHAVFTAALGFVALAILICAIGHAVFSLAVVNLDYEKRWYLVTDRSLRIREGVAVVREITFTFANIQNLSVSQGPIQRALGIADLKVETAGGGSGGAQHQQHPSFNLHTAYFRGIDNAEEVKQLIATRMRGQRDSGLGDQDDAKNEAAGPAGAADGLEAVLAEARALRHAMEERRDVFRSPAG
jgi:membrane protein YdbS with pleckstrin-like domain